MKLYTKGGDDGTTGMADGTRVLKSELKVTAYGEVDETNAAIGVAVARCEDDKTVATLRRIQSDLFVLGAQLSTPPGKKSPAQIDEEHIVQLEHWIDAASDEAPALKNFVLPGGCETAAHLHLARTFCRRAERSVVALAQQEPVGRSALAYVNRLSDLLFALARLANHRAGVPDIPWLAPQS
jgi:cob(I)alamin adenosyltransferase